MTATALAPEVFTLPIEPNAARRRLSELLADRGWPSHEVDGVVLAVHEALTNAHRHGGGAERAVVRFVDATALEIEVSDRGPWFDPAEHIERSPDPMAERGRGLWLITRIASDYEVHRHRDMNRLRFRFHRS